ncbi:5-formyltetrahydrofolate cyclo-ligase [Filomicrobium sp.]|uniref:5-formyltetrahydrofolate cyclo-ligase n=1 Tax=Filomicrobium sp. TaxID=2024831 RepID=UPI00258F432A|nr:5-formyltetrahydrofolate cyclo-ligase [Filomicrobium sp.]MCV0370144.1 5-formyltetrahydrofolate cyclo-ligase [Filomicrobium sp.]
MMTTDPTRAWRRETRERILAQRNALSVAERERLSEHIIANLDREFRTLDCRVLGLYWPIKCEIDVRHWANQLSKTSGIKLALPVVVEKKAPLEYWEWAMGDPMVRGVWNIPVPAIKKQITPDVVISPLVGFSGSYRLGYGGGFFDRTLASLKPRPYAIGIGFDMFACPDFVAQPHDIAMDTIITETRSTNDCDTPQLGRISS